MHQNGGSSKAKEIVRSRKGRNKAKDSSKLNHIRIPKSKWVADQAVKFQMKEKKSSMKQRNTMHLYPLFSTNLKVRKHPGKKKAKVTEISTADLN